MENNPFATILETAGAFALPRSLHTVADLGVADFLDGEPRSAADLAAEVGAHPDALARVLRLLAAHDIFAVDGDMVRHTPASQLLRTDHPQSMRDLARMFGLSIFWQTLGEMGQAVRTGAPATVGVYPDGFWAYTAENPEAGRIFNGAMEGKAQGAIHAILATYDFSTFGNVADIAGGNGHLLHAILDANPHAKGVLFELPHVIAGVSDLASDRLTLQAGDFFRDELPTSDAYLLMEIIHDWGDSESNAILRAVRQAADPGATLLVIEQLIADGNGPDWAKTLDIHMLTLLGGRQRTQAEYVALLNQTGFAYQRQIDTPSGFTILEAIAA